MRRLVFRGGEPIAWYGVAGGEFDHNLGADTGKIAAALEAGATAEVVDTAVGRGGEVHEGRVPAAPEERVERATEALSAVAGVYTIPAEQAAPDELRAAGMTATDSKADGGEWIPYEGPRGGNGWRSVDSGEVVYQDEPPGELLDMGLDKEGVAEIREMFDERGLNPDDYFPSPDEVEEPNRPPEPDEVLDDVVSSGRMEVGSGDDALAVDIEPVDDTGPWADGSGVGVADSPESYGNAAATVEAPTEQFADLQEHLGTRESGISADDWWLGAETDGETLDSMVDALEEGGELPIPYVEVGRDGSLVSTQEGRHRVLAAGRAGLDTVPFRLMVNPSREGKDEPVVPDDGADEKSWVPYEGPQGGTGWKDTDNGQVVYQEEPPGEVPSASQLEEAAEQSNMDLGPLIDAVADAHDGGGSGNDPPGVPESISDFDVDWSEVDESSYIYGGGNADGYPVLSDDQRRALENELANKHGTGAASPHYSWADSWKTTSYSTEARTREMAFQRASGYGGDVRNHGLEEGAREPTDAEVAVASDLIDASRHFVRENMADEDDKVTLHRGLGSRHGDQLKTDVFAMYANDEGRDWFELTFNAMDNYSASRDTAASWGRETATVTEEVPVDEVMVATDMLMNDGQEGEISIKGGERPLRPDEIDIEDEWSPDSLLDGDPDDETMEAVVDTAERMVERFEHDAEHGNDLPFDPEAADGIEKALDEWTADATDDRTRREAAVEDILNEYDKDEALKFGDDFNRALGEVVEPSVEADIMLPFNAGIEKRARAVPDELTEHAGPEKANEVLERLTGEPHYLEDGHKIKKAEDLKERLNALRGDDK